MQKEQKCKCCGSTLSVYETEHRIPYFDDGGSLDSFDIIVETETVCTNPDCDGYYSDPVYSPSETEKDDLPF